MANDTLTLKVILHEDRKPEVPEVVGSLNSVRMMAQFKKLAEFLDTLNESSDV